MRFKNKEIQFRDLGLGLSKKFFRYLKKDITGIHKNFLWLESIFTFKID